MPRTMRTATLIMAMVMMTIMVTPMMRMMARWAITRMKAHCRCSFR